MNSTFNCNWNLTFPFYTKNFCGKILYSLISETGELYKFRKDFDKTFVIIDNQKYYWYEIDKDKILLTEKSSQNITNKIYFRTNFLTEKPLPFNNNEKNVTIRIKHNKKHARFLKLQPTCSSDVSCKNGLSGTWLFRLEFINSISVSDKL